MIKASAIIRGNKSGQKPGWFYLSVDKDFGKYYSWLSRTAWREPMNGCHATIIAGEHECRLINKCEMTNFLEKFVDFWYSPLIMTDKRSFWLDIVCDDISLLRNNLGLPPRKLHLTLGNLK